MNCIHPQWVEVGGIAARCTSCSKVLYFDQQKDPFHLETPTEENVNLNIFKKKEPEKQPAIKPDIPLQMDIMDEPERISTAKVPEKEITVHKSVDFNFLPREKKLEIGKEAYEKHDLKGVSKAHGIADYKILRAWMMIYIKENKLGKSKPEKSNDDYLSWTEAKWQEVLKQIYRNRTNGHHLNRACEDYGIPLNVLRGKYMEYCRDMKRNKVSITTVRSADFEKATLTVNPKLSNNGNSLPPFKDDWDKDVQIEWLRSFTKLAELKK